MRTTAAPSTPVLVKVVLTVAPHDYVAIEHDVRSETADSLVVRSSGNSKSVRVPRHRVGVASDPTVMDCAVACHVWSLPDGVEAAVDALRERVREAAGSRIAELQALVGTMEEVRAFTWQEPVRRSRRWDE